MHNRNAKVGELFLLALQITWFRFFLELGKLRLGRIELLREAGHLMFQSLALTTNAHMLIFVVQTRIVSMSTCSSLSAVSPLS